MYLDPTVVWAGLNFDIGGPLKFLTRPGSFKILKSPLGSGRPFGLIILHFKLIMGQAWTMILTTQ